MIKIITKILFLTYASMLIYLVVKSNSDTLLFMIIISVISFTLGWNSKTEDIKCEETQKSTKPSKRKGA